MDVVHKFVCRYDKEAWRRSACFVDEVITALVDDGKRGVILGFVSESVDLAEPTTESKVVRLRGDLDRARAEVQTLRALVRAFQDAARRASP